jgi:hypothetical protein
MYSDRSVSQEATDKRRVDSDGYPLTNTDYTCWLHRRIVQDALPYIVVEMCAVVIGLDSITLGVVSVCVKGIEVRADPLHRLEVLFGLAANEQEQL